jgi:hypothetical protein
MKRMTPDPLVEVGFEPLVELVVALEPLFVFDPA